MTPGRRTETLRRFRRTAMFLLALVLVTAIWELYKLVGPQDGGTVFGWTILPRANDIAMPHVWEMLSRYADPERRGSSTPIAVIVLQGDIAVRLLTASLQGWAYCRDNVQACTDLVVAQGSQLGASHQLWQMNEINQLIWPAESGVGFIDEAAWDRTVQIAQETPNLEGATVLTAPPDAEAFTNDIVTEALANLEELGVDTVGADYEPIEVTLEPGGA